jgi:hypothetical protein
MPHGLLHGWRRSASLKIAVGTGLAWRGEGDYEPPGYTDAELEELLGEGGTSGEDA